MNGLFSTVKLHLIQRLISKRNAVLDRESITDFVCPSIYMYGNDLYMYKVSVKKFEGYCFPKQRTGLESLEYAFSLCFRDCSLVLVSA